MANFVSGIRTLFTRLSSYVGASEPPVEEIDPFDTYVLETTLQYKKEIADLRRIIQRVDDFVFSHPELLRLSKDALKDYKPLLGDIEGLSLEGVDPKSAAFKVGSLMSERLELKRQLIERKEFLECNPEIKNLFKAYLLAEKDSAAAAEISGLLTDLKA